MATVDMGFRVQLRVVRALLWLMTFQLVVVPSKLQQNSPGYLGCFEDTRNDRALPVGPGIDLEYNKQSVEWCFRYCLEHRSGIAYKYAGLENTHECWCGNNEDYDKHGKKNESDCQDRCPGNSDQICGDSWRLSVYKVLQGVCSNDTGPPTHGTHAITNPPSVSYNLNNFKFFRTRVDFSCDPGYTLHGASSIECNETDNDDVTWSDSVPTCEVSPTTFPKTTTILQSTTDSLMTTETPGTNDPNTRALQTGAFVAIAAGAAVLTELLVIVILLYRKRRKKKQQRSDVTMATVGGGHTNDTYALPEIVSQSITDQSTIPVYGQVNKKKLDSDVCAASDDVTSAGDRGNAPSNQPKGAIPSRDQESGWVENPLHTYEARINFGQTDGGSPVAMEGNFGWVENIILE